MRRTAYHEAGHAVAALVMGVPLLKVWIREADGHIIARCPVFDWRRGDGRRRPLLQRQCVYIYAGAAAERLFCGAGDCGDEDDRRAALWLISGTTLSHVDLKRRARSLVRRHAEPIERVAGALIAGGRLSCEDVEIICHGLVRRPKDPATIRAQSAVWKIIDREATARWREAFEAEGDTEEWWR